MTASHYPITAVGNIHLFPQTSKGNIPSGVQETPKSNGITQLTLLGELKHEN
jgi:hypothetical protein